MDVLYSIALLVSLITGSLGILMSVIAVFSGRSKIALARTGLVSTLLGIAALVVSVVVHRYWGHGAGSLEPMAVPVFFAAHAAFIVAGVILAVALVVYFAVRVRLRGLLSLFALLVAGAAGAREGRHE